MSPRSLFVAPRIPYPLENGWNQRMFHLLTALGGLGPVDLVCYADPVSPIDDRDLKHVRDLCDTVRILPLPPAPWATGIRTYRDVIERLIVRRRPSWVAEFPGQPLASQVAALAGAADLIWAERLFLAEWLATGLSKTIVDVDDVESVKQSRQLALEPRGWWRVAQQVDNFKLARVERRATTRYARAVVCAERDRWFFDDPRRVLVVPNGVSAELLAAPALPREPDTLVMVGTMRYAPNVDGALWFTREILPRVAAVVPSVRLFLVGDDRLGLLKPAHDGVRVFVTGRVEDVTSYVSRATLSVVPLRVAGGTRIKILESMALGTPVVSTTIGAEGLDVVPGRHLSVADTPDRIAAAIVDLLRDETRRRALAEAGCRLVAERYTWDTVGRSLRDMISEWLTEQSARRGLARMAAR